MGCNPTGGKGAGSYGRGATEGAEILLDNFLRWAQCFNVDSLVDMKFKPPFRFLIFASLGCLVLGFAGWMLGNPDFEHKSELKNWCNMAGLVLILLGDIGLAAGLFVFSRRWLPIQRFAVTVQFAVMLSVLSCVIFFLEYGVFNFGDYDLPPYQPDTLFERTFDFVWIVTTIGAGVAWPCVILCVVMLLVGFFKRRMDLNPR
jgi:hypothetical protein